MTQKFFRGDLVKIADDLGESMSHFEKGCLAVCRCSAEENIGGSSKMYMLYVLPDGYSVAWYEEDQLTLVEPNTGWRSLPRNHILRRTEEAREARV